MKRLPGIFLTLIAALVLFAAQTHADSHLSLQYQEAMGDTIRMRHFLVEANGNGVAIQSTQAEDWIFTECDAAGNTRSWHVDKEKSDYLAVREGNTIRISGSLEGEPVDKELEKDGLPWFQSLYYSLSRFVKSDKEEIRFWMIRPDNLSLVKLVASKEAVETIRVNGQQEATQKVRISATGLLSLLWHGHYWYRQDDGVLLQYKDGKALPGRAKIMMYLSQAENS